MFLINHNNTTDPSINLALEEYCLRSLDSANDYFLFYINAPSIVAGNSQYTNFKRMLSHGTLLFDTDSEQ